MITLAVIAFCVLLLVLAFVAPRLSRHAQRAGDKPLAIGQRAGGSAPGPLGRLFSKMFGQGRRAVSKSGSSGRKARAKAPL